MPAVNVKRNSRRAALSVGASALTVVGLATAALAAAGTVNTAGAPLTVRSGPGTGYSNVGSVKDGAAVTISCQARGTSVSGTYGTSNIWDKIGTGRYVADAYVRTGSDGLVAPVCGSTTPTPSGMKDDYPYRGQTSGIDPWHFYKGQCTSFVAWRLNSRNHIQFTNGYKGQHFGNANSWDNAARAAGISVTSTPRVGDVAQSNAGSFGHVAVVARVNASTVVVEEYNYAHPNHYGTRTVARSAFNYIHFPRS